MEKKIEKMTKAELLDLLNHKEEVLQEKIKQIEDLQEKLEDEIDGRDNAEEQIAALTKNLEEEVQTNEVLHETIDVKDAKIRKYKRERIVYLVAIVVLLSVVGCIL